MTLDVLVLPNIGLDLWGTIEKTTAHHLHRSSLIFLDQDLVFVLNIFFFNKDIFFCHSKTPTQKATLKTSC